MDRATVAVYEDRAREWQRRRGDATDGLGREFRAIVGRGLVVDLGCGIGRYFEEIGAPLVGFDATSAMLALARRRRTPLIQGDLEALPFRTGELTGAFARHSYLHIPRVRLPSALLELRRIIRPGGAVLVSMIVGDYEGHALPDDDFPGRLFALWTGDELVSVFGSAGFVGVQARSHRSGVVILASTGEVG